MELLQPKCVFTGVATVALGQLKYVFATAAGFMCTSSDVHRDVIYGIAETEGVSIGTQIHLGNQNYGIH